MKSMNGESSVACFDLSRAPSVGCHAYRVHPCNFETAIAFWQSSERQRVSSSKSASGQPLVKAFAAVCTRTGAKLAPGVVLPRRHGEIQNLNEPSRERAFARFGFLRGSVVRGSVSPW